MSQLQRTSATTWWHRDTLSYLALPKEHVRARDKEDIPVIRVPITSTRIRKGIPHFHMSSISISGCETFFASTSPPNSSCLGGNSSCRATRARRTGSSCNPQKKGSSSFRMFHFRSLNIMFHFRITARKNLLNKLSKGKKVLFSVQVLLLLIDYRDRRP